MNTFKDNTVADSVVPGIVIFGGGYGRRVGAALRLEGIGQWFVDKYQAAAIERGHRAAAAQLRKQGVPLGIALRIFFNKEERPN